MSDLILNVSLASKVLKEGFCEESSEYLIDVQEVLHLEVSLWGFCNAEGETAYAVKLKQRTGTFAVGNPLSEREDFRALDRGMDWALGTLELRSIDLAKERNAKNVSQTK
jgi:hypothetical protein